MKKTRLYSITALFLLLALSSSAARTSDGISPDVIAKIETLVTREMERVKAPAISLAIATGNKLRYAKGFGKADLENQVPAKPSMFRRNLWPRSAMFCSRAAGRGRQKGNHSIRRVY